MASASDAVAERVRAQGPLPFAEYMRLVLYDPQVGFYARPRAGREGDFATSPTTTPEFGRLLAVALDALWRALDQPGPFVVVEGGAAQGELARAVLAAATRAEFGAALRYHAVEQGAAAREAAAHGPAMQWHRDLSEVSGGVHVVLANELLDNLPADRFVVRRGEPRQRLVGLARGRLAEVDGPPLAGEALRLFEGARRRRVTFDEGHVGELRTATVDWVRRAARLVPRGYLLFLDYGGRSADVFADPEGGAKTYRGHRAGDDPLASPGECDVTVPVDFDLVAEVAGAEGFHEVLRSTQRDLLLALGAAERAAELARARSPAEMAAWAGLREVLFGSPGTDITAQLLAKGAPPPAFAHSR